MAQKIYKNRNSAGKRFFRGFIVLICVLICLALIFFISFSITGMVINGGTPISLPNFMQSAETAVPNSTEIGGNSSTSNSREDKIKAAITERETQISKLEDEIKDLKKQLEDLKD